MPEIIDLHCDALMHFMKEPESLLFDSEYEVDLPKLKSGGVAGQLFAVFPDPDELAPDEFTDYTLGTLEKFREFAGVHHDLIEIASTASDVRRIAESGRIAAILGLEGGHALSGDLGLLAHLRKLGVRLITITWNNSNALAGAAAEDPEKGLTGLGREAISRMNNLGIIPDLSHASVPTFYHVLSITRAPAVCSHSNSRSVHPHRRNLSDDQVRALAAVGGMAAVNFHARFLNGTQGAEIADVLAHLDHFIGVAGPEHVGLGSDFDGAINPPAGLLHAGMYGALAGALAEKYPPETCRLVMGENFLRVLEEAERVSAP